MKAGERSAIGLLDILKRGLLGLHSSGPTGSIRIGCWSALLLERAPRKQASSLSVFGSRLIDVIGTS